MDRIVHWTDSTTVLCWLNNDRRRLQLFVHNKVKKIQGSTDLKEWRWIPTDSNPADLPTRGTTATQLRNSSLWKEGPPLLVQPEETWPTPPMLIPTSEVLAEMKKGEQVMIMHSETCTPEFEWERFSSWNRLQRILFRILQWREKARRKLALPTSEGLWRRAELLLLRQAQLSFQPPKQGGQTLYWKQLGYTRLVPFQDASGLWRGSGRLRLCPVLPQDAREPILLPPKHPASILLLRHLHEKVLQHTGGVNHLLSRLHARFWLPRARATAFAMLQRCVPCRRQRPRPRRPPEGLLPDFRMPPLRGDYVAFGVTAVDCAGPFRVKRGRSYETYYMLLFTCCQIRAVRIEYLSNLSVDAFMLALTRASARGVNPHTILSDNGGNFDGANRLLRTLWKNLPQEELEERNPKINWRFNPPVCESLWWCFREVD